MPMQRRRRDDALRTMDDYLKSVVCGWVSARPYPRVYYKLVISGLSIAGRGSDLPGTHDVRTFGSDRTAAVRSA
jgi:hypothetical protein